MERGLRILLWVCVCVCVRAQTYTQFSFPLLMLQVAVTLKAITKLSRASEKTDVAMLTAVTHCLVPKCQKHLFHASSLPPRFVKTLHTTTKKLGFPSLKITTTLFESSCVTWLEAETSHLSFLYPTCRSGPDSYCRHSQ